MKSLAFLALLTLSFATQAASVYECEFTGPNYLLTINDDQSITLENNFKSYSCSKGTTNFPGTVLELKVLNCSSGRQQISFFYADYLENTIFLSKNLALSKDIVCKKL